MKKRNTKNFLTRLTAFIVMALMLVPIIPLTVSAETLDTIQFNALEDGTLLLQMDSMDPSTAKSDTLSNYDVTVEAAANSKAELDANDSTKILAADSSTTGSVGVKTNLPLGADTKYTIEYYAKMTDYDKTMGMSFGFMYNTDSSNKCISVCVGGNNNKVYTYSNGATNRWFLNDSTSDRWSKEISYNPWTSKADQDGYVRYVFTFDGKYIRLSIGGVDTGYKWDITKAGGSGAATLDSLVSNTGGQLYISAGYNDKLSSDGSALTVGDCAMQIKNISVYKGVRTAVEVRDEDGNVLKKVETFDEEGIAATAFNQVEGDQVIWCDPYTGAVVEAPSGTYTSDTVFIAKSRDRKASDVIGVQLGEVGDDGKRNIRIVGGMYNTEGTSVGFDVLIEYMKDGELKQDKYRITSTSVYESINANVDGDITNHTAKDLGANYLIVLAVEGVDTTNYSQIDFKVASFRTFDGNDARVYSEIFEFSIVDGKFTTTADRLA